jgi:hypothetical protein
LRKGVTMKKRIFLVLILLFFAQNSFAMLNDLIRNNVNGANKSYEQIVNNEPARLWIHVRSKEQEKAIQDINSWFKNVKVGEGAINLRPIQLVKNGPKYSQLRFFFKQDKDEAIQFLMELRKIIPHLQLNDLSGQYRDIGWLKPGHYELWIAPDVIKFNVP